MTFKEVLQNTDFQWAIIHENVYDIKKKVMREDWPVYGAFYRDFYCGFWYNQHFFLKDEVDGTEDEVWLEFGSVYSSIKKLLKDLPNFKRLIKEVEIIEKKIEIEKDFKDD